MHYNKTKKKIFFLWFENLLLIIQLQVLKGISFWK